MSKKIKVASAQIEVKRLNSEANIENHVKWIRLAGDYGVDLIVFPELSVTGYERELAREQAFTATDRRLNVFQELANKNNINIVIGLPLIERDDMYIASLVFSPNIPKVIYKKTYLHVGEDEFFCPGKAMTVLTINQYKIALSICYDIEVDQHIIDAKELESDMYVSSIFYSSPGMIGLIEKTQLYNHKYRIPILISNFSGCVYNSESGGGSMFVSDELNSHLSKDKEGLLICSYEGNKWTSKKVTPEVS